MRPDGKSCAGITDEMYATSTSGIGYRTFDKQKHRPQLHSWDVAERECGEVNFTGAHLTGCPSSRV